MSKKRRSMINETLEHDLSVFGHNTTVLREEIGITKKELATKKAKISINLLSDIENNKRINVNYSTMVAIANALDTNVCDMLYEKLEVADERENR